MVFHAVDIGFIGKIIRVIVGHGLSYGRYWLYSKNNSCSSNTWFFMRSVLALFER